MLMARYSQRHHTVTIAAACCFFSFIIMLSLLLALCHAMLLPLFALLMSFFAADIFRRAIV